MSLQDVISKLIKDEIEKDSSKIGYLGKTDEQIAVLLNGGITKTYTAYTTEQPPISRILNGVGFAPNICTKDDVAKAKEYKEII